MRICLVYDCLFPYTVGGAERWYRNLAERLAADGHEVTYLTLRQWDRGDEPPTSPGVRVVAVGPRMQLYARRRAPAHRAAARLRRAACCGTCCATAADYDVVHTASFPYFSLLAAALARPLRPLPARRRLARGLDARLLARVPRAGRRARRLARAARSACACRQRAFCFSRLHAAPPARARACAATSTVLEGEYAGALEPADAARRPSRSSSSPGATSPRSACRRVVAGGRAARASGSRSCAARSSATAPSARRCCARDRRGTGSTTSSTRPGFVDRRARSTRALRARAVHAAAVAPRGLRDGRRRGRRARARRASSSRGPDNAATELVEDGVNGFVAASAAPEDLAAAIVRVHDGGAALRERDRGVVRRATPQRLSLERSLRPVAERLRAASARA